MENVPTLRNDSSFIVQFSFSVSKTRAILLFTIKIVEKFELYASIPGMIRLISSDDPAKNFAQLCINMRMFRQSTNQNHYPVFG